MLSYLARSCLTGCAVSISKSGGNLSRVEPVRVKLTIDKLPPLFEMQTASSVR